MIRKLLVGLGLSSVLVGVFSSLQAKVAHPFAQQVHYHDSHTPSQYTHAQLARYVARYYHQWKREFVVKKGAFYRTASDKKDTHRTVSEGQGYGMMIVALMAGEDKDAQKIFDGMYGFVKAYPSEANSAFMTWQIPEKKGESDSAFDGDADIAYALLLASKQWGNEGKIDYAKEAKKLIDSMMTYVIGKQSHLPLLGDWVDQNGKKYNQFTTRTSDFMPSHFRAFYRFSGDSRWLKVVEVTNHALRDIMQMPENKTALVSDFIRYNVTLKKFRPTKRTFLEEADDSYAYNACRVPMRIGLDALLNGDKGSQKIAASMLDWIKHVSAGNPQKIYPGYRLSGKAIDKSYTSSVFTAPFGVAAKLGNNQPFLNAIFDAVKENHENYYEDSVNLISQLIMIDAFWDPTTVK